MWIIIFPSGKFVMDLARLIVIVLAAYLAYLFVAGPTIYLLQTEYWLAGVAMGAILAGLVLWLLFTPNGWRRWPALVTVVAFVAAWGAVMPVQNHLEQRAIARGEQIAEFLAGAERFDGDRAPVFLSEVMPEKIAHTIGALKIDEVEADEDMMPGADNTYPAEINGKKVHYKLSISPMTTGDDIDPSELDAADFFETQWPMVSACARTQSPPDHCQSTEAMEAHFGLPVRQAMQSYLEDENLACVNVDSCRTLASLTGERFGTSDAPKASTDDVFYRYCMEAPLRADEVVCDCVVSELRSQVSAANLPVLEDLYQRELAAQSGASWNFKAVERTDAIRKIEEVWPPILERCGL